MSKNRSYLIVFWNPVSVSGPDPFLRYLSSFFQRYGDIQCLDCGGRRDARTCRLLRQADLVVFPLHQNYRELCRLFCQYGIRFPNCVWMITDYVAGAFPSLRRIQLEFRIPPARLACISYRPQLQESKKEPGAGSLSADIRRDLNRAGKIMLQALGF